MHVAVGLVRLHPCEPTTWGMILASNRCASAQCCPRPGGEVNTALRAVGAPSQPMAAKIPPREKQS